MADQSVRSTVYVLAIIFILTVVAFSSNQFTATAQKFVYQADGFLHGSVFYHTLPPSLHDSSVVNGQYYWAPGPLPAVLLMPGVAIFGLVPLQVYLNMLLLLAALVLTYLLAKQDKFSTQDSLWLALAFTFASIYLGEAYRAHAWQVSSAAAAVAVLLMLVEYRGRQRPWLVGLAAAAALATRLSAGLALLVPVLAMLFASGKSWQQRIDWLKRALAPIAVALLLLASLNYARTGNWWDTGYGSAQVSGLLAEVREREGLVSLKNIPTNVYFYFLATPRPVFVPGTYQLRLPYLTANIAMGFFWLSPIFLYLWRLQLKERFKKIVALVAAVMTVLLLSYYAFNAWEFGPRYLTDVLPLYYLLLLTCFVDNRLVTRDRVLIALSAAFNLYLFTSMPWWSIG